MQLSWSIEGEKQLSRRLIGIRKELKDWKPAFKEASGDLVNEFSGDVFSTKGASIGVRWQPLDRNYANAKAKRYPGKDILEATGKMKKAFTRRFSASSAVVWNTAAYFKYHQSNQPRSKLPRRVMMKLGNSQKEMIVRTFNTHFRKKLR